MEKTPIRKMPIGIQDFEDLRVKNYVYVDKTAYLWKLVTEGKPYFLSRPRRFGKSLLLTTLKAYFLGKKVLFDGLAVSKLETEWQEYPMIHLDFNPSRYDSVASLNYFVMNRLKNIEKEYQLPSTDDPIEIRFQNIIESLYQKTGKQVVVLVDEYDKPLLETMDREELNAELRAALKPFYGVLKSTDAALRFVMLTGVTRFSKVSIFSDLNQLREIGLSPDYSGICGITEKELLENFKPDIEDTAKRNGKTFEEMLGRLRKDFNGYHFTKNSESVYNPFSLLNTFANHDIQYYWFASGTPTFLFHELERTKFDVLKFDGGISIGGTSLNDYQPGSMNPVPLLYQSGYLTIAGYDADTQRYKLDFPNEEVRYGFFSNLLPVITRTEFDTAIFHVANFSVSLRDGDMETFFTQLTAFFALIPYDLNTAKDEKYFQTIFYVMLVLLGHYIDVEVRSAAQRDALSIVVEAVVKTKDTIYVFEFKIDKNGTADEALKQIDGKGYLVPYTADGRRLVKAGVVFDTEKRTIGEWKTLTPP